MGCPLDSAQGNGSPLFVNPVSTATKRRERQAHQRAERIGRSYEISDLVPRFFASGEVKG